MQGTPSRSLHFLQSCWGGAGRGALQAAGGFLVRKKGAPRREGWGVGYPPTPFVSQELGLCLWVTEELILRSGGEVGGLSWGAWRDT